jgi:hypothetical protein
MSNFLTGDFDAVVQLISRHGESFAGSDSPEYKGLQQKNASITSEAGG